MAALLITRIIAPNPGPLTGTGTNTFVVGDGSGCVVIDPGVDDAAHLAAVATAGMLLGGIAGIIVTHGHPDHVGGAAELAARTGAPVLAMSRAAEGVPCADVVLTDGEEIVAGSQRLTVLATPGHRFDHCCLWHAPSGIVFVGDLLAGSGTVVIAPPEGDMQAYLISLERLRALPITRIWPGHGAAIDDPQVRIDSYITHRQEREQQVLAALRSAAHAQTLAQLLLVVYADTATSLHTWAARSLLAHLFKLVAEGRVKRTGANDETALWSLAP